MHDLPIGYILLFLLVAGFLYYRFLRGRRRKGRHGRELWRQKIQERRQMRLEGAQTWEERRHRMEMNKPQWKIADRYLRKETHEEPGRRPADTESGQPGESAGPSESPEAGGPPPPSAPSTSGE